MFFYCTPARAHSVLMEKHMGVGIVSELHESVTYQCCFFPKGDVILQQKSEGGINFLASFSQFQASFVLAHSSSQSASVHFFNLGTFTALFD